MNKEFLREMYNYVSEQGYSKSYDEFEKSMQSDEIFRNELYNAVKEEGYEGDNASFVTKIGGGAGQTEIPSIPDGFDKYYNEKIRPTQQAPVFDKDRDTPQALANRWKSSLNESWSDPQVRKDFAIHNRDKLTKPTLDQWRTMSFDERTRSLALANGVSIQEAREKLDRFPSATENELFGGSVAGGVFKDGMTMPAKGIYSALANTFGEAGAGKTSFTQDNANGIIENVVSDPMLPLTPFVSGMGGQMVKYAPKLSVLGNILKGPIAKAGYEGAQYGLGQTASQAVRPEGVTSEEFRDNMVMGIGGDLLIGGGLHKLAKGLPDKITGANIQGNPSDMADVLVYGSKPENRLLMQQFKGGGLDLGKEIVESTKNPKMFKASATANRAIENMPDISGDELITSIRGSIPNSPVEYTEYLTKDLLSKRKLLGQLENSLGVSPDGAGGFNSLNQNQLSIANKQIPHLKKQIGSIVSELKAPPKSIEAVSQTAGIKKANEWVDHLAKQMSGKDLSAKSLRDFRIDLDQNINWERDGVNTAHTNLMEGLLVNTRTAIKDGLEKSALSTGDKSYIKAMREMSEGFTIRDNLADNLSSEKSIESWVSNLKGEGKTGRRRALKAYDDYFGTDYTPKAEAVGRAKVLQVSSATGEPSTQSLVPNGKSEAGLLGSLPFIPSYKGLGASGAGELIPKVRYLADKLQTPNVGAIFATQGPQFGDEKGFVNSTNNAISNTIEKSLFGDQTEDEYYNQGFN